MFAWRLNPYALAALISTLMSVGVMVHAWRRRPAPAAKAVALFMLCAAEWSLTYALELGSLTMAGRIFWAKAQYVGIVSVSIMMLVLTLVYTGREKLLGWRFFGVTGTFAVITLALVWTNEAHHLIWPDYRLVDVAAFEVLDFDHGLWFWLLLGFSYLLLLLGSAMLLGNLRRTSRLYRTQALTILIGTLFPWLGNLLYVSGFNPFPYLDLTPFAFTLTGIVGNWGLFHVRLLDITPVARHAVVESISDGVIVLDVQGRVVDVNPVARRLIGKSEEAIIGQRGVEVLAPWSELVERFRHVNEAHADVAVGEGEARRDYDLRISPLYDGQHRLNGRVIVFHDATDRKQTEMALRAYQAQLERQNEELRKLSQAIEQSASTVVITDLNGSIEYANPAFTRITGYTLEEATGQNPRILKSEAHDETHYREMWETITAGEVWQGEFLNRRKDGSLYWEDATIAPIQDDDGEITHFIAVKTDITARKQAEQALQESRAALRRYAEELEAQNAELDAYAHTVAHDLKNPLSAIDGFSQLLVTRADKISPDKRQEMLQIIHRTSRKMRAIIDELLLLASVRETDAVERAPVDMGDILEGVHQRLAYMIEESHAEIAAPEAWPRALGYAPWIEEVWTNYVSNALKYGGQPPRVILGFTKLGAGSPASEPCDRANVTLTPPPTIHPNHDAPGTFGHPTSNIIFWVRDNGQGLTAEQQSRLFKPFERLDNSEVEGHGLGLTIVQRIVEKLGGEVGVESAEGQGSTFWFTLPAAASYEG